MLEVFFMMNLLVWSDFLDSHLMAMLLSTGAIVLAEMGDKTQLLAMAFAAKYKAYKVLVGVFIATLFNHALAVLAGNYLLHFESAQTWVQGIASLSFILFGLWSIRGDKLEGEENRFTRFGAVATVALAFFLAEMGDKTQLATIALATKFPTSPLWILIGTTTGMLIADSIGIIVGVVMAKKIPERIIKLVSAGVFILFGFIGVYQVTSADLNMKLEAVLVIMIVLAALTLIAAAYLIRQDRRKKRLSGHRRL
jgi:putative Ca2+/H+ antiporter (TMEM165/GDT1 family)